MFDITHIETPFNKYLRARVLSGTHEGQVFILNTYDLDYDRGENLNRIGAEEYSIILKEDPTDKIEQQVLHAPRWY